MERRKINKLQSGKLIKQKIIESKYSIEEIANLLGLLSPRVIYEWIKGNKMPSLESIYNLAIILNCDIEEFISAK